MTRLSKTKSRSVLNASSRIVRGVILFAIIFAIVFGILFTSFPRSVSAESSEAGVGVDTQQETIGKPTNVVLRISSDAVRALVERERNFRSNVRENMLGTRVTGVADTQSVVRATLRPSQNEVDIELTLNAKIDSHTSSTRGAAHVTGRATTTVEATKRVKLTSDGWELAPTQSSGATASRITDFRWRRLGGYQAAFREAQSRKPSMDQESVRRARQRVSRGLDAELNDKVAELRQAFEKSFRRPLAERGIALGGFDLITTEDAIGIGIVVANPSDVHPPEDPLSPNHDVVVALHESLFNNVLQQQIGGQTLREASWSERFPRHISFLDPALRQSDPEKEWAIRFDKEYPIKVDFSKGRMDISLNAEEFALGAKRYPAATITVSYSLTDPRRMVATRLDEKIRITFPESELDDSAERPLSVRRQVFRSLLRKRFEPLFVQQWELGLSELLPDNGLADSLELQKVATDREWLLLHYALEKERNGDGSSLSFVSTQSALP